MLPVDASIGEVMMAFPERFAEAGLAVPEHLSHLLQPGLRVVLYHGPGAALLGWYLPDRGIGFDLRS